MMKFVPGKNAKVTLHDPDFEKAIEGDDEEHLEAPHRPVLAVNVANNNACILLSKNVLEGHTRSRPRSSFSLIDSNYLKLQRNFNFSDKVDLQTLKRVQELYTDPYGININLILLISQLMWIVNPKVIKI